MWTPGVFLWDYFIERNLVIESKLDNARLLIKDLEDIIISLQDHNNDLSQEVEELIDEIGGLEEDLNNLEILNSEWGFEITNDGTILIFCGDNECPQDVLKSALREKEIR